LAIFPHEKPNRGPAANAHSGTAHSLARGLGWFSIGLGLMEVLAPRTLARSLGMRGSEKTLAGYGVREIATGIGILSSSNPTPWIWGRVGGDALDVATLATGLESNNRRRGNVVLALGAVASVSVLDVLCARLLSTEQAPSQGAVYDYSTRRGMPRSPNEMRGAARDFEAPRDMRIPEAMRPYTA
jgi:hypothetical protein